VHGEIVAFAVCALSHVQGNDPARVRRIVERSKVRAHPKDLGVTESSFRSCLLGLREYARSTGLDASIVDVVDVSPRDVDAAWAFVNGLPPAIA
jgi:hypothetical protein